MEPKIEVVAPIRDQVAHIIRRQIIDGALPPESQISERQLSRDLHISTTPVKEALRVLQAEGLIVTKPRKGSFVAQISKDQLLALSFMRSSLEGVAAYWATKYISDKEIAQLEAILDEVTHKLNCGVSVADISANNVQFHSILRNASRNQYLLNLLGNLNSMDLTIRTRSLYIDDEEPRRAHQDHLAILKAVQERNSTAAEEAMVNHIRRVAVMTIETENI